MTGESAKSEAVLLFGRIARRHRFVLEDDLDECLGIQERLRMMGGARRLGEILVDQGYMTEEHVEWILGRQGSRLSEGETLFGDLAVANGFLSRAVLARALKAQRRRRRRGEEIRIGEILVGEGALLQSERDALLLLQRRLRGKGTEGGSGAGDRGVLLLEAGRGGGRRWRPLAAAVAAGLLLAALAALAAVAVFR